MPQYLFDSVYFIFQIAIHRKRNNGTSIQKLLNTNLLNIWFGDKSDFVFTIFSCPPLFFVLLQNGKNFSLCERKVFVIL